MTRAIAAGVLYFLLVFAAGFALGMIRVLVLLPRISEIAAVLIEIPVILAYCWIAVGYLIRRFSVPDMPNARIAMGGLALALLLVAEVFVSLYGFGRSFAEHLGHYATLAGALGLAGQLIFGLMPLFHPAGRT